jgi:hypothetical protein
MFRLVQMETRSLVRRDNMTPEFIAEVNLMYDRPERERFRQGLLQKEWAEKYPEIFDADDLRLALGPQKARNHYFEWLGAVRLYEFTGYLSLVEKYDCRNHARKHHAFRDIVGADVFSHVVLSKGCPDLLLYAPDRSDWFFCEIKGATDRLWERQLVRFKNLCQFTQKRLLLLNIR